MVKALEIISGIFITTSMLAAAFMPLAGLMRRPDVAAIAVNVFFVALLMGVATLGIFLSVNDRE